MAATSASATWVGVGRERLAGAEGEAQRRAAEREGTNLRDIDTS